MSEFTLRDKVKKVAATKVETTMVYPLSQFEEVFGAIWGHGVPEEQLTDGQRQHRALWNSCREKILDNGNRQKRILLNELENLDFVPRRYTAVVLTKGVSNRKDG